METKVHRIGRRHEGDAVFDLEGQLGAEMVPEVLADDDALDRWIRQTVGTARHVSGTCKMGPDADPMAVVDQYCRIKGVQGLWVVDASVMPRIPRSGGAHATVVMIGERVVDWIAASEPRLTAV